MTLLHNQRYGHLFVDQPDDPYLFVARLGDGCFSHAQLVWHVASRQLRVRKAPHQRRKHRSDLDDEPEVRVAAHLAAARPVPGIKPRIARLVSHSDVRSFSYGSYPPRAKWSRVSYWDYYNGGELAVLVNKSRSLPPAIVARFLHQILQSLEFCYRAGVVHRDLNSGNVWVHWSDRDTTGLPDFYIGDFGLSSFQGDPAKRRDDDIAALIPGLQACGFSDRLPWDIPSVLHHVRMMLCRCFPETRTYEQAFRRSGPLADIIGELQALDRQVEALLVTVRGGSVDTRKLPSLAKPIHMAQEATSYFLACDGGTVSYRSIYHAPTPKTPTGTLTPMLYRRWQDPLVSRLLLGPWYIGVVDAAQMKLMGYYNKPHYRPNPQNSSSDTDGDEGYQSKSSRK